MHLAAFGPSHPMHTQYQTRQPGEDQTTSYLIEQCASL